MTEQLALPYSRRRLAELLDEFVAFDTAHPAVWRMFERFAFEAIDAGHARFSADAILHRIRWETSVVARSADGFKCNDHFTAFYARKWQTCYPAHRNLFETRRQRSRDRVVAREGRRSA